MCTMYVVVCRLTECYRHTDWLSNHVGYRLDVRLRQLNCCCCPPAVCNLSMTDWQTPLSVMSDLQRAISSDVNKDFSPRTRTRTRTWANVVTSVWTFQAFKLMQKTWEKWNGNIPQTITADAMQVSKILHVMCVWKLVSQKTTLWMPRKNTKNKDTTKDFSSRTRTRTTTLAISKPEVAVTWLTSVVSSHLSTDFIVTWLDCRRSIADDDWWRNQSVIGHLSALNLRPNARQVRQAPGSCQTSASERK